MIETDCKVLNKKSTAGDNYQLLTEELEYLAKVKRKTRKDQNTEVADKDRFNPGAETRYLKVICHTHGS